MGLRIRLQDPTGSRLGDSIERLSSDNLYDSSIAEFDLPGWISRVGTIDGNPNLQPGRLTFDTSSGETAVKRCARKLHEQLSSGEERVARKS
jgi:hypothetical protein